MLERRHVVGTLLALLVLVAVSISLRRSSSNGGGRQRHVQHRSSGGDSMCSDRVCSDCLTTAGCTLCDIYDDSNHSFSHSVCLAPASECGAGTQEFGGEVGVNYGRVASVCTVPAGVDEVFRCSNSDAHTMAQIEQDVTAALNEYNVANPTRQISPFDVWVVELSPTSFEFFVQPHSGYSIAQINADLERLLAQGQRTGATIGSNCEMVAASGAVVLPASLLVVIVGLMI
jgi:hypothetical protein